MSGKIILGDRTIATPDMLARAARAATGLNSLVDVGEGDTVAILMRNDYPFLEATFAADFLGAYAVPVNWHFKDEEIAHILTDAGADVLVLHADLLAGLDLSVMPAGLKLLVAATPPELQSAYGIDAGKCDVPHDQVNWSEWLEAFEPWSAPPPAQRSSMIYTSGTTGRPKGVRRQPMQPEHHKWLAGRQGLIGAAPDKVNLTNGPMYHSAPNAQTLSTIRGGGTLVLQARFEAEDLLRLVEKHKVSHMHMVPIMFVRLSKLPDEVKARYDLSSLAWILHAAAPCPADVKRVMIDWWGPIINEYYGATETGMVVFCNTEEWLANAGTVGKALPGVALKILDDERNELPMGEVGEIFAHFAGFTDFTYQNNDAEFQTNLHDGLFSVGDVGYLNERGYLFISDRKRDMVISGGVNIYPSEIEALIVTHPGVRDCAVFGIPDDEYGEALAAVVEPSSEGAVTSTEIQDFVGENMARYKVPRLVELDNAMPREDSGKIRKREL
ncbi:MAG: AMP-binding protein, partial [Rhodospirillaceae bacterium]|nr:AMP-binding protein [Rhodospirillaceae bacterium]